jgi:hypothetical protein
VSETGYLAVHEIERKSVHCGSEGDVRFLPSQEGEQVAPERLVMLLLVAHRNLLDRSGEVKRAPLTFC